MIDQTDRFQSIDEMIEKFDMLFASYQVTDRFPSMIPSRKEISSRIFS